MLEPLELKTTIIRQTDPVKISVRVAEFFLCLTLETGENPSFTKFSSPKCSVFLLYLDRLLSDRVEILTQCTTDSFDVEPFYRSAISRCMATLRVIEK